MIKCVLILVFDKLGIIDFVKELKNLGWDIILIGGIKVVFDDVGVEIIVIDDVIGFLEMMDGCVKIFYLNIYGGFLVCCDVDSYF